VPWFPFNGFFRGRLNQVPREENQDGLRVLHPRFFSVPRYLKFLDGFFYAASLAPFLGRLRRQFSFDLIDSHFIFPDGMGAVILGKLFRRPVVVTLRGAIVRLSRYRLHRAQLRWTLRSASQVLSVSDSLKRVAVSVGVSPGKVRVIPNGVDVERFHPMDRAGSRQTLGLPAHRPIVLSVGGLKEGKGHHRILRLLPQLLSHRPDLLYVIVGGERPGYSFQPLLDDLVARHSLHEHVLMVGERSHDEVPVWLAAADLFVLATRSEGWANALLESLACGRPVVSTNVGGNPEIVTGPHLGILVAPEDDQALLKAICDALERTWDAEVLAAHARMHSWDTAATNVLKEFRQLVAAGGVSINGRPAAIGIGPQK
jgi:glycosyltransferase involved in cell wall biosynthesis